MMQLIFELLNPIWQAIQVLAAHRNDIDVWWNF